MFTSSVIREAWLYVNKDDKVKKAPKGHLEREFESELRIEFDLISRVLSALIFLSKKN